MTALQNSRENHQAIFSRFAMTCQGIVSPVSQPFGAAALCRWLPAMPYAETSLLDAQSQRRLKELIDRGFSHPSSFIAEGPERPLRVGKAY